MIVPNALRCTLQVTGARRRASKVLQSQVWPQLLQPPAKSWVDFERQLAQLVEQLVLRASPHTAVQHQSSSSRLPGDSGESSDESCGGGDENEGGKGGDEHKDKVHADCVPSNICSG